MATELESEFGRCLFREEGLRLLVEQLPAVLWSTDTELRITSSLGSGLAALGLRPNQLVGTSLFDYLGTDDPEFLPIASHRRALQGEAVSYESEWKGRHYETRIEPFRQADGTITGCIAVTHDITERKGAEQTLRQSQERYRAFIANSSEGIWCIEAERPIPLADPEDEQIRLFFEACYCTECNEAMARMYGFASAAEFRGKRVDEFLLRSDPANTEYLRAFIRCGYRLTDAESHEVDKDGQSRYFVNNLVGILENGCLLRAWGTQRDITERKRAEQERRQLEAQMLHAQKLESLGVLAGGIAHDFNNLLTGMLGYADLARRELPVDSPAVPLLEEVEKAAWRATDLTKQMLAYAGKGSFVILPCNLSLLVQEMTLLLGTVISKKAKLHLELDPNLCPIEGDATQLRQVVMNLITNASDALGDQSGVIRISTRVVEVDSIFLRSPYLPEELAAGVYACVEVADTGCGMAPETLGRIFEPFFTTKFTGRGLGLAATLGIVRGHRGTIKVSSMLGQGTTFQVLLPRAAGTFAGPASSPAVEKNPSKGTVLVVDSAPLSQKGDGL